MLAVCTGEPQYQRTSTVNCLISNNNNNGRGRVSCVVTRWVH